MSAIYYGILTALGEQKEARAKALGQALLITHMCVGDGGLDDSSGATTTPRREQTALVRQRRQAPINQLSVDPANLSWLIAEQVIPEDAGGFWIREIGLRDSDGDLIAVSNCPPTYKPLLATGSARTQVVRLVMQVSSAANFELKIDPAIVLATRKYVDDGLLSLRNSITSALNNKLDKTATAVAATKLATARTIAVTGGATASAKSFDGTANVALEVTALDVAKANTGTLPVKHGGTGVATVAAGSLLKGAGTNAMVPVTPAQILEDAKGMPLAGGRFTGAVVLDAAAPLGTQYGVNDGTAQTARVLLPAGGGYSANVNTTTGAMRVMLPPKAVGNNTMLRLRLDLFEYVGDKSPATIYVHAYIISSLVWANCTATVVGGSKGSDYTLRFGSEAGRPCFWIGELDSRWSYTTITLAEVHAKYNASGTTVADWGAGWDVQPVSAFDSVTVTLANNLVLARSEIDLIPGLQQALDGKAAAAAQIVAGNGLTGGGTLGANRTLTLGTPGALTAATANTVTATSHTHALDTMTSTTDTTANRLMTVGAFGLGAPIGLITEDLDTVLTPGFYGCHANANATVARNYPVTRAGTPSAGTLIVGAATSSISSQLYIVYNTGEIFTRGRYGNAWSEWASSVPNDAMVGQMGLFAGLDAPVGWLKANGADVSRAVYAALFARIGTRYGAGNGSTTFTLPDARGEFLRGWDDGRSVDAGRVLGSTQADMIRSHTHGATATVNGSHAHGGSVASAGEHQHISPFGDNTSSVDYPWGTHGANNLRGSNGYDTDNSWPYVSPAGAHIHGITADGSHTHSITVNAFGGVETRPRNVAFLACIKY